MEGLNYTELYAAYSSKGRKPVLEPKTMFKILVYAYSQNIYSSREIEKSCRRDINFRWILAGAKAPDHSTIDRFHHLYAPSAIEGLFYQLVNFLYASGELQFKNVFIDGTKIEASANRYSFVWKKVTLKNEAKMHIKIHSLISGINRDYMQSFAFSDETAYKDLCVVLDFLKKECQENRHQQITFKNTGEPIKAGASFIKENRIKNI